MGWFTSEGFSRKLSGAAIVTCLAALSGGGSADAAAQYTLRLASFGSPAAPQVSVFVESFRKHLDEATHGQIAIADFPAGSLVRETAVVSAVQSRVVDISLTTFGNWSSMVPAAGLLNSIFFHPTPAKFESVLGPDTPLFKSLNEGLQKKGVVLLSTLYNGPSVVVSRLPMMAPHDFRGKTIRAFDRQSSEIIQTLGGAPSTLAVADVYTALQRGMVQAALGGLQGAIGLKEYEVSKYLLWTNGVFGVNVTGYVMNESALSALPPPLQKAVIASANAASHETNVAIIKAFQAYLAAMRKHGMQVTELEPGTPQYQAFVDALGPLLRQQQARYPAAMIQAVLNAQR